MFCRGKEKHHPLKCPLFGKLGLKIINVSGHGRSGTPGASLGFPPLVGASNGSKHGASAPPAAAPAAVVSPLVLALSPPSAPAALMALVEEDITGNKSLSECFWWYGDKDGVDIKSDGSISIYSPSPNLHHSVHPLGPFDHSCTSIGPSCSWGSLVLVAPAASHTGSFKHCSLLDADPLSYDIILPPGLMLALLKAISPEDLVAALCLVMVDIGRTDHIMVPDCSVFISYKSVCHLHVWMGDNSYAPILGHCTAIISLNGQCLLICNVLHVPTHCILLYSLRAHLCQCGCGFVGSHNTGMHIYFPGVVLSVDTSTDCHLSYEPLGKLAPMSSLHFIQPRCPSTI